MGFFRDSRSRIPIPGIRDQDFLFGLHRKIPKSQNPGDRDFKTSKKSRVKNPENPEIPEIGIYFFGISRSGGAKELKDPTRSKEALLHP